ncbi:MAG: sporulation sigma factor SigE, partial [Oscillospiraceae bacterium]|nr:sporulation sigma factor SigE [Oscillospiraceae bacterium]
MNLFSQIFLTLRLALSRLQGDEEVHYLGGADQLPPPLTRAEEEQAFAALAQGDDRARETLIVRNLRLVVYIAKKFESPNVTLDDLISIGTIGLMK